MPDTANRQGLFIYAPVPLYRFGGDLWVERQAVNGLRLWARHFARVVVAMPSLQARPPQGWVPAGSCSEALERVQIEPLPMAYRPDQFLRALPGTRRRISQMIAAADYLSFAIGGLFGDWGAVACFEARRQGRAHAVWTDRVESEVMRGAIGTGTWRSSLRARLYHRPMAWLERLVISRADLGLFHGAETFDAYAPCSRNPQLVHDIHISGEDHIDAAGLAAKAAGAASGPLRIAYAGRADPMKGPIDWLAVLERLNVMGVDFQAVWLGDGSELAQMRTRTARAGLQDRVRLPGYCDDHGRVLAELRQSHLFMFCHKTPESPRCLIEALTCGSPLLGYDGAYARDLISSNLGGALVRSGDTAALAAEVARLAADRKQLARMIRAARADGEPFTDAQVFAHRSAILKKHLPAPRPESGPQSGPQSGRPVARPVLAAGLRAA